MDQRQQPSRVASKRKSEDIETNDDHQDEIEDLQERLDRILGSDSGSEYSPEKVILASHWSIFLILASHW